MKYSRFFLFIMCSALFYPLMESHASAYQVNIEFNPEYQERYYSVTEGSCRFKWEIYLTEINRGIIGDRSLCGESLQVQAAVFSDILKALLNDKKGSGPYDTLFWRRLYKTEPDANNDMSVRLVVAALRSPKWDRKTGRFQNGYSIVTLANDAMIYQELSDVFNKAGLKLKLISAEKILISRADNIPFYDRLKKYGIKPEERFPFDCMIWFSISELKE